MSQRKEPIIDARLLKIAAKLKRIRIEKGYSSYEEFALEFQLDRKQYWRIEKGSNLTLTSLLRVLDSHQISLSDFFSDF